MAVTLITSDFDKEQPGTRGFFNKYEFQVVHYYFVLRSYSQQ